MVHEVARQELWFLPRTLAKRGLQPPVDCDLNHGQYYVYVDRDLSSGYGRESAPLEGFAQDRNAARKSRDHKERNAQSRAAPL